jgi:hypothetical protein
MTARLVLPLLALGVAGIATGCGGGSSGSSGFPTIGAAKTYGLARFTPAAPVTAGTPVRVSFVIRQPDGSPLTRFRRGPGPHTGVHLIIVRRDLNTIIHRHPPVGPNGTISETITFPEPGPYRVVVDAYPATGQQRNFQLFGSLRVAGAYVPKPLPPFASSVTTGGYTITLHGRPDLHAIEPAFIKATVTDPSGRPARFQSWYGALAHAIFFRRGSLDYFHTHVCAPGASGCTSILAGAKVAGSSQTPGKLTIGVLVPAAGTWRLFLQCRVNGHVLTAPFTLVVKP